YSSPRPRLHGRKRNERLGRVGPGSSWVAMGKAQSGQMAGCGYQVGKNPPTSHRGNPEGQAEEAGRKSGLALFRFVQPTQGKLGGWQKKWSRTFSVRPADPE